MIPLHLVSFELGSGLHSYFLSPSLFCSLHGAAYGTQRRAWGPGLSCQVPAALKSKLAEEKAAQEKAQTEDEILVG
jgi:hypothetical protein